MSNLIGIAPLQSPTFAGTASFENLSVGQQAIPDGVTYDIAASSISGSTSITISGSFTMNDTSTYYVSGTGIKDGTTIVSATVSDTNTVLTLSSSTTAALTTKSTISISEIKSLGINFYTSGSEYGNSSIIAYGGDQSLLSGTLNINASMLNLNSSTYVNGTFNVENTLKIYGDAGSYRSLDFNTGTSPRFSIQIDNSAEGTGNSGSNMCITSFDDTGGYLSTPLSIDRETGIVNISNLNVTSQIEMPNLNVGLQSMSPVTYNVSTAADSGSTSIVISGNLALSSYATYYVSGTGIADNTLVTSSTVDSTTSTTTIVLSNPTTAALTTSSTIDIATNYQTVIDIFASGLSTPDGVISVLGGYGTGYSGIFDFVAGEFNFNGSSDINFAGSEINFKSPSYFQNSVYVGSGAASDMESLNFLTSGDVTDYDARIFCQGGSATSGSGLLTLQAGTIALAPGSGGFNIETSSFNLGINQSAAGATFINFFSNGDNEYADFTLQSYGGTTGASGGGTVSMTCSMLQMKCNEVDMTDCSWGVMVPTPTSSSTDQASQKAVNMAYLNSSPTLAGGLTLTSPLYGSANALNLYYGTSNDYKLSLQGDSNLVVYNGTTALFSVGGSANTIDMKLNTVMSADIIINGYGIKQSEGGSSLNFETGGHISVYDNSGTLQSYWSMSDGNTAFFNVECGTNLNGGGWTSTAATTDNSTRVATTAYVKNNLGNYVLGNYGVASGDYAGKALIWGNSGTAVCFCYNNGSSDEWITLSSASSSDPSLKENMIKIESKKSLDSLSNIDLYSYDWKDKKKGHVPVGFNSKNLLEVWPETIQSHEQVEGEPYKPDTVNLLNLIARLTDCIKEQQTQIDELKSLIKSKY